MNDSLAQLKDIHLPEAISWWPPAIGWWLLLLLLVVIALLGWWSYHCYQRQAPKRSALAELALIEQEYQQHQNSQLLLEQLSQLLRRSALHCFPCETVAGLIGDSWLQFLDQTGDTQSFTQGSGQLLAIGPYQNSPLDIDGLALIAESRDWLTTVFKNRRPHV